MNKEFIKNTMEEFNPTEEQSRKMWERLSQTVEERNKNKIANTNETANTEEIANTDETVNEISKPMIIPFSKKAKMKPFTTVAAAVAIAVLTLIAGNIVTDSRVYAQILEWLNLDQGRQDIIGNMMDDRLGSNTLYAQSVYYLDEKLLVFGGLKGIVIYDLQQDSVVGTIDTTKIDCVYFHSEQKNTCILKEKNEIIVFNSESDEAVGNYYAFDLTSCMGQELEVARTGDEEEVLKNYYEVWKSQRTNYVDTFERFFDMDEISGKLTADEVKWSNDSYVWKDAEEREYNSFLMLEKDMYMLVSYNVEKNVFDYRTLDMTMDALEGKEQEDVNLHQFMYIGENDAIRAIYEYLEPKYLEISKDEGLVFIPGYQIYKEVWVEEEYLVFGNFYSFGYLLTGNILVANTGEEMPACFHLKKSENGYEVVSVDVAGDGTYGEDIAEFTKDYPELYDLFLEYDEEKRMEARREYLQMYVTEYNLDVEYFKDYGWDPIPIFDEELQD